MTWVLRPRAIAPGRAMMGWEVEEVDGLGDQVLMAVPVPSSISTDWTPLVVAAATALGAAVTVTALFAYWVEKRLRRPGRTIPDQVPREPAVKAA